MPGSVRTTLLPPDGRMTKYPDVHVVYGYMFIVVVAVCWSSVDVDASGDLHLSAEYSSSQSIRVTWRMNTQLLGDITTGEVVPLNKSARGEVKRLTQLEVHQHNVTLSAVSCGHGNPEFIQHPARDQHEFQRTVWGLNSSLATTVCVKVKVTDDTWLGWANVTVPIGVREPPLLQQEPEVPRNGINPYTAFTTSTGVPRPSWAWVINNERFNTSKRSRKLRNIGERWGLTSPDRRSTHLVLQQYSDTLYPNHRLDVYYVASNVHGYVRSSLVTLRQPFIEPEGCERRASETVTIVNPAGVVVACTGYDVSFPDMQHTWMYCGQNACQLHNESGCQEITNESETETMLLMENNRKLVLTHALTTHTGCYKCFAKNKLKGETCLSETYLSVTSGDNLRIETPSRIHTDSHTDTDTDTGGGGKGPVEVLHGGRVHLECVFQIFPYKLVTWLHNDTLIDHHVYPRHLVSKSGTTLDITDAQYSDEGDYRCEIRSDGKTYKGQSFKVIVHVRMQINLESQVGFHGDNVTLYCDVTHSRNIQWFKNMAKLDPDGVKYEVSVGGRRLTLYDVQTSDTATYSCNATSLYGYNTSHASVVIMRVPEVTGVAVEVDEDSDGGAIYHLACDAVTDANLDMNVTWVPDAHTCTDDVMLEVDKSPLVAHVTLAVTSKLGCIVNCVIESGGRSACAAVQFRQQEQRHLADDVECTVQTGRHDATTLLPRRPHIPRPRPVQDNNQGPPNNLYMVVGVAGVCAVLFIIVIVVVVRYHRTKAPRGATSLSAVQYSSEGVIGRERFVNNSQYICGPLTDNTKNQLKEVEIPRSALVLGEMIGRGQFGRVYKGSLVDTRYQDNPSSRCVAVKTLKYKPEEKEMVEMFLREALMMKGFNHPHVLSLIGITFDGDRSPLVVLPYMDNADLRTYISGPHLEFQVHQLLRMGVQVAIGMSYLSNLKFVHRDLAARNCMVDKLGSVRVADFGLSRDIYQQEYYRTEEGKSPLPIRWMALECLEEQIFTSHSDVWSFGVLLWELVTRGATPYPGVENWALLRFIKTGGRMPQPLYCPNNVYEVMKDCWGREPKQRPTFHSLQIKLEDILANPVTSDPETAGPRSQRRSTLEMGIKTARVTRLRTDSGMQDLTMLKEMDDDQMV